MHAYFFLLSIHVTSADRQTLSHGALAVCGVSGTAAVPSKHECLQHRRDLEEVYDAVITDPPYGVRAGGRKSVSTPDIHIGDVDSHYPQTDPYPLGECLRDLLDAAAKGLRTGGRLVRYFHYGLFVNPDCIPNPNHDRCSYYYCGSLQPGSVLVPIPASSMGYVSVVPEHTASHAQVVGLACCCPVILSTVRSRDSLHAGVLPARGG